MLRYVATVLGVLAVVFSGVGLASAEFYSIVDLGVPLGYNDTNAYGKGLNSSGVAAVSTASPSVRAFLKNGSTWTDLGVLDATKNTSVARGINDGGDVVGHSLNASGVYRAYLWTSTGGMQNLGTLGADADYSYGMGVNADGVVIGYSKLSGTTNYHAFTWTSTGGMVDLGTLGGASSSYWSTATAINDSGQIVGASSGSTGLGTTGEAYRYSGGTMTPLGTFGGNNSLANGINADGDVVGAAKNASNSYRGYVWTEAGGMIDLGILSGFTQSTAYDINSSGQIVGAVSTSGNVYHAAIYTGDPGSGEWVDLNTMIDPALGWTVLSYAMDINDSGQILGFGTIGGKTHAFILTIPEPSSFALLASGLIGLLAYAWRKRK